MKRPILLTMLTVVLLLMAACGGTETVVVTVPVEQEVAVTATSPPVDTPEPAATERETAVPTPAPTKTLSPVMATQQALVENLPTRPPATNEPVIAPDDYVALVDQGCQIVRENYVRDNFNGVDWEAVCADYRDRAADVTDREQFLDLMSAFINELNDNHSRFVPPDRFASEFDLPTQGSGRPWAGMTVWPAREDEHLFIWHVCEVGAAAAAGLQRGDIIQAVNGEPIPRTEEGEIDRTVFQQALYAFDTSATLTVQQGPDQEPEQVTLQFGGAAGCDGWRIGLLSESPRIGYVRVPDFGGDSDTNLLDAIERLEDEAPLEGLVVDVRHNPGGNSDRDIAIFTSGEFGKTGPLRADATQTTYRIRGPVKWNETTPMAVLTDGSSHSAAEYFATAMKQSDRATLVGMPTAGNTEGISGFNLADGSLIRLAVMTLQLPDGRTLEGTGVIPDIKVPLGKWGLRQTPDVQLQAAFDELLTQIEGG